MSLDEELLVVCYTIGYGCFLGFGAVLGVTSFGRGSAGALYDEETHYAPQSDAGVPGESQAWLLRQTTRPGLSPRSALLAEPPTHGQGLVI